MKLTFGVIGGDRRQAYLAELLRQDGFSVRTYGLSQWNAPGASVLDDAADADAVALREVAEVVVLDDLQEEQPGAERREAGEHHEGRGDYAPAEQALFGPVILEADGACHDPRAPLSRRVD